MAHSHGPNGLGPWRSETLPKKAHFADITRSSADAKIQRIFEVPNTILTGLGDGSSHPLSAIIEGSDYAPLNAIEALQGLVYFAHARLALFEFPYGLLVARLFLLPMLATV